MRITTDVTSRRRFGNLGPSNWTFRLNQVFEEAESSLDFSSFVCKYLVSWEIAIPLLVSECLVVLLLTVDKYSF